MCHRKMWCKCSTHVVMYSTLHSELIRKCQVSTVSQPGLSETWNFRKEFTVFAWSVHVSFFVSLTSFVQLFFLQSRHLLENDFRTQCKVVTARMYGWCFAKPLLKIPFTRFYSLKAAIQLVMRAINQLVSPTVFGLNFWASPKCHNI